MRGTLVAVVAAVTVAVALLGGAGRARAQEAPPEEPPPRTGPVLPAPAGVISLNHRHQGGLGLIVGTGYRGLVKYQDTDDCGKAGKTFCTSRLPTFLDLEGSFGVTRQLSVIVDFRVGLEQDFTHSRPLALAPGIKYYIDADDRLKFFITFQLAVDFTGQLPGVPTTDFGIRDAAGLQFDINRIFGVWLQLGDTLAFRRYFRFELDAAIGVEGRFPP